MDLKKVSGLTGMFLFSLFLIAFVSADVDVTYEVHYGIIEEDLSLNETEEIVSDFNVYGYTCSDIFCSSYELVPSLTGSSSSNEITLTYPINLIDNSYTLYFEKDGYVGWEQYNITWHGTGVLGEKQRVYLSKKRIGTAEIEDFSVESSLGLNKVLWTNVSVELSSEILSAIIDNQFTEIPIDESVLTLVGVEIYLEDSLVWEDSQDVEIAYSSSEEVVFSYIPDVVGEYEVLVYTEVIDEKILNSIRQEESKNVLVFDYGKTNFSYSFIENFSMNPTDPEKDEEVEFTIDYGSYFVNGTGDESFISTTLFVEYILDDTIYETENFYAGLPGTFSFNKQFFEEGNWDVVITATPTNPLGNETINDTKSLSFTILPPQLPGANYSISEIGDFSMNPTNPEEDEEVEFTIKYNSSFVDENNQTTPLNTTLLVEYFFEGSFLGNDSFDLNSSGVFEFDKTFYQEGDWIVRVTATPTNPLGNETINDTASLSFEVEEEDEEDDDDNDCGDETNEDDFFGTSIQTNGTLSGDGTIMLKTGFEAGEKKSSGLRIAISLLLILIFILLLIAIYVLLSQKV